MAAYRKECIASKLPSDSLQYCCSCLRLTLFIFSFLLTLCISVFITFRSRDCFLILTLLRKQSLLHSTSMKLFQALVHKFESGWWTDSLNDICFGSMCSVQGANDGRIKLLHFVHYSFSLNLLLWAYSELCLTNISPQPFRTDETFLKNSDFWMKKRLKLLNYH